VRLLYWGDAPTVSTGFGVVARHVLGALHAAGHEIGTDIEFAGRGVRPHADDAPAFLDQRGRFRLHLQMKARIALAAIGEEIQEVPLRHQRDELAARRQVAEVDEGEMQAAELAAERARLGVGQLEEFVEQAEFAHHLERGGMDRVAAEIAQEIGVLLQHHDVDTAAREQEAEHHAGRSASHDAAAGADRLRHHSRSGLKQDQAIPTIRSFTM